MKKKYGSFLKKPEVSAGLTFAATAGCLLTAAVLIALMLTIGSSESKVLSERVGKISLSQVSAGIESRLAAAGGAAEQEQEQETGTAETASGTAAESVHYTIDVDSLVAPEPDQNAYGETSDVAVMCEIIAGSDPSLNTEGMYFSESTELMPGTSIRYYQDETILAVAWKEVIDNTVYTFTEVSIADASQFRRFLAGGSFGSGQLALTTEMSATVNAVVAASADFYSYRGTVIAVNNGEVLRSDSGWLDVCFIDYDGNFHMLDQTVLNGRSDLTEFIENYVAENNINFCLEFGPILYDHGTVEIEWGYPAGACGKGRARSAICQMGTLHYMIVDANMEGTYQYEPTIFDFAEVIARTGCEAAFALDGGQTASVTMNDELVNQVSYGSPRLISDIIYFATAIPAGE